MPRARVLFVCLGNICRSPMAEAVFRKMLREHGLERLVEVDSAGLSDWHAGERPHRGTLKVLDAHGIDHKGLYSRPVTVKDLTAFDYIVAMDAENMAGLRRLGAVPGERVFRLLELVPDAPVRDVPDPYYTGNFDEVYELIESGCRRLLTRIAREYRLPYLPPVVTRALETAVRAHRTQLRKCSDLPYIAHPVQVAWTLWSAGCDEDVVAAALLHDTVEDTEVTLDDIRSAFGPRIAGLVAAASEPDKSLPWETRKRHTIETLRGAPLEVKLVVCADKLHNVQSILADLQRCGREVWRRFARGPEAQLWYYEEIAHSLREGLREDEVPALFTAYEAAVSALRERMNQPR